MFKELPAWGFYVRHAKGIIFENVRLICEKKDYRTSLVFDDVQGVSCKGLNVVEPEKMKNPIYFRKSAGIVIEK